MIHKVLSGSASDLSRTLRLFDKVLASVIHAKSAVNDACEDFVEKSKRAAKVGRRAAEDFVDHAERRVKKYPKSAVATGIMTGIILGFCLGWLLARRD